MSVLRRSSPRSSVESPSGSSSAPRASRRSLSRRRPSNTDSIVAQKSIPSQEKISGYICHPALLSRLFASVSAWHPPQQPSQSARGRGEGRRRARPSLAALRTTPCLKTMHPSLHPSRSRRPLPTTRTRPARRRARRMRAATRKTAAGDEGMVPTSCLPPPRTRPPPLPTPRQQVVDPTRRAHHLLRLSTPPTCPWGSLPSLY
jgi:hypothetical protein